jgi:zinc D-Ala-D-Ala carboxypeptidase
MIKYLIFVLIVAIAGTCNNKEVANEVVEKAEESAPEYSVDFLMGKFEPADHPDFRLIPSKYADKDNMYIHKDVLGAFIKMAHHASQEGITLQIRSATRNFDYQKGIWERKWAELENNAKLKKPLDKGRKILEYSSMPGSSRHHWGTEIDLNSFDNAWFEAGEGKVMYDWLLANAADFGFCRPYTKMGEGRNTGYFEEKWHWSYTPLSQQMTTLAGKMIQNEMMVGFQGAETAKEIDIVKNYILGINQECINAAKNP